MRYAELPDMIEFVLRQNEGPTAPGSILQRLHDLKLLDRSSGIEEGNILFTAKAEPERFVVDTKEAVWLTANQFEQLASHFRKRIWKLMDALRGGIDDDISFTTAVLVHALYVREPGSSPQYWSSGAFKDHCLQQTIQHLAARFPEPMRRVVFALDHVHHHMRSVVDQCLLFADLVKPTTAEATLVMRELTRSRSTGTSFVPYEISWLMAQLINGHGSYGSLLDLHLDAGVMPVVLHEHEAAVRNACGLFIHPTAHMLMRFELDMLGHEARTSKFSIPQFELVEVERVIAASPWGKMPDPFDLNGLEQADAPTIYTGLANSVLTERGVAAILVPAGFLFSMSKRTRALREELLQDDRIEAVVQLPIGAFKPLASVQTAIVVLNRSKAPDRREQVLMIQLEDDPGTSDGLARALRQGLEAYRAWRNVPGRCHVAHVGGMQYDGYNLLPSRHIARATAEELEREDVDGIMVHLAELVLADHFERVPSRISQRLNRSDDPPAFVRVRNLAKDPALPYLQLEESEEIKGDVRIVDRDAVLVSRQFANPLPTIYQAKGGRIAIASNVLAIQPDTTRVLPEYLVHEMRQPYYLQQIKASSFGASIPAFNREALLSTRIRLRPLERQRLIVGEKRSLEGFIQRFVDTGEGMDLKSIQEFAKLLHHNIHAVGHEGMAKYLHQWLRHEVALSRRKALDQVGDNLQMLGHEVGNTLDWVTTGIGTLESYLQNLIEREVIDEDDKIAPSFEDDADPSPTVKAAIGQVMNDASELSSLVDRMARSMDGLEMKWESIDAWELVNRVIAPRYRGGREFRLMLFREEREGAELFTDGFRLKQVLFNIMNNSVKHGFLDPQRRYNLVVGVGAHEIVIANDGAPPGIPLEEMVRRGRAAGVRKGTGQGMYWVKTWLDDMGAELSMIDIPKDRYGIPLTTAFRILIPPAS